MKVRRYNMQDCSAPNTEVDDNLSILQVFHMSDWTEESFNQVLNMQECEELMVDGWIYVYRRPDVDLAAEEEARNAPI